MKHTLLFLFAILLVSCQKEKPLTPQNMILGVWSSIDTTNQFANKRGFEFFTGSIFEDKYGFHSEKPQFISAENSKYGSNAYYIYFGTESKYTLSNDSLRLFNPVTKKWSLCKVEKLTPDTLKIAPETTHRYGGTFVKKTYKTDTIPDFDAVFLYSSPCFGISPVVTLLVKNNGDVLFSGRYSVKHLGLNKSKISKEGFNRIQERFKRADYMNLKESYAHNVTDGMQCVYIYFIKNNKIVKTVRDCGTQGTNELAWAYLPLIRMGQLYDMKEFEVPADIAKKFNIDTNSTDVMINMDVREKFDFLTRLSENL